MRLLVTGRRRDARPGRRGGRGAPAGTTCAAVDARRARRHRRGRPSRRRSRRRPGGDHQLRRMDRRRRRRAHRGGGAGGERRRVPAIWPARAATHGAQLVHVSTDYVFDGTATTPVCRVRSPRALSARTGGRSSPAKQAVAARRQRARDRPHGVAVRPRREELRRDDARLAGRRARRGPRRHATRSVPDLHAATSRRALVDFAERRDQRCHARRRRRALLLERVRDRDLRPGRSAVRVRPVTHQSGSRVPAPRPP